MRKIKSVLIITIISLITVTPLKTDTLIVNVPRYDVSSTEMGWYLNQINITNAWDFTTGSEEIVVAVVDSGIDFSHPEITNAQWINNDEIPDNGIDDDKNGFIDDVSGWDFVSNDNNPGPEPDDSIHYHATFISGIIAGSHNEEGIAGIAPNVKIMDLRILNANNYQATAAFGGALYYAVDNGADVINLSLQYYGNSTFLRKEIQYAYDNDVTLVSITGNLDLAQGGGSEMISLPGGFEEVISVGALNYYYEVADYSNYGLPWTELVAPVGDINYDSIDHIIQGIYPPDAYGWGLGTSYACPQIVGVIALMKSLKKDLTIQEIRDILHETAIDLGDEGKDKFFGYGLVNASGAVLETQKIVEEERLLKQKIIILTVSIGVPLVVIISLLIILIKKKIIRL